MTPGPAARVLAVGGARDGVGKTVLAVNAALSLLAQTRARVLLLDLDVDGCGDAAAVLGLRPPRTIAELLPYLGGLTTEAMRRQVGVHPSGLGFLPLGDGPDAARTVDGSALGRLLDLALPLCDYAVADCGADVNPTTVRCMERAAGLFVVATPDVLVLRHTRRLLERLQALHFPARLLHVLLNRADPGAGISPETVASTLGRPVGATFAREDAEVQASVLAGRPFATDQPRARITRACDAFVRHLLEAGALDAPAGEDRPLGVRIEGGRARGLDAGSARQAAQIDQWMRARGPRAQADRTRIDARTALKMVLHKRLVEVLDLKGLHRDLAAGGEEALVRQARSAVSRLLDEEGAGVTDRHERERIVKEVLDEALGLGPLEDLLADDAVTEIMVNGRGRVFVEIGGRIVPADVGFTDDAQLMAVIERIVRPLGRRIDEKSPMVDARLPDGSRVNAVIPPLALDGPCLTVRKFAREPFGVDDLVRAGTLTPSMAALLRACVEARLNVVISGGTGSGKTTLLNVLSSFVPSGERIVTIEDSAELQLRQPHVVRLESRPANIEGEGQVTIRDLVRNALRMRPDRIVVGECRGAETLDMLQAMNTGHDGSLTTLHANSPRDSISRLETLVLFAGLDLPSRAIREQVASAVHLIVQIARLSDGTRKVVQISEVTGMEGSTLTLQDLFLFRRTGVDAERRVVGRFEATGLTPRFGPRLEAMGIALPDGLFGDAAPIPRGRA